MINFAENLNKMITAGLGGETEAPRTEIAVGHRTQYLDASGPVASFETNIVAPLKKLIVSMLPVQAGSGDPSPENVRPISGFESVSIARTGINIWDEVWEVGGISNTTGANVSTTDRIRSVNYIVVKPNTAYYVNSIRTVGLRFYDRDKNYIGYATKSNASFITADNCYYIRVIILATTEYGYNASINYPATDHDYHPGNVQSVTIALGQTVCGGTLDVVSGKLTVTSVSVDIGALTWSRTHSGISAEDGYIFYCTELKLAQEEILCSNYPYVGIVNGNSQAYNKGDKTVSLLINTNRVYVRDDTYTTVDDFQTANSGQQLVYYLATPLEIDLTPQQITTLIGDNNIFSDAGDVEVTYTYYEETEGY